MTEQTFPEHLKEEIRELQQRLEAKKRELGETTPSHEREVFQEVFRERFDEIAKSIQAAAPAPAAAAPQSAVRDDSVTDLKKEEEVEKLLYIAFKQSPVEAIRTAHAMGPFWLDELHDRLADEYYEKLLEFRKVEQL